MINFIFVDEIASTKWGWDNETPLSPGWYCRTWGNMFGPQPNLFHWTQFYLPYLQNCDTTFEGRAKLNLLQGVMDYVT